MAYPYVKQTWTDGVSQTTAARMGVMEQGIYDAHHQAACRAYHNTTQSVANSTYEALEMNSELFDQDGLGTSTIHDNAVNNSRLTARVAGYYMVGGNTSFSTSTVGTYRIAAIVLNAVFTVVTVRDGNRASAEQAPVSFINMVVNDYVELWVWQDSGAAMTIPATPAPNLWMARVA